jgi:hypothetical protein
MLIFQINSIRFFFCSAFDELLTYLYFLQKYIVSHIVSALDAFLFVYKMQTYHQDFRSLKWKKVEQRKFFFEHLQEAIFFPLRTHFHLK